MPAWGAPGSNHTDEDSWNLVHFIRHLRDLTPDQLREMEAMNPKGPQELDEEREEREFLSGSEPSAPSTPSAHRPPHNH